MFLFIVWVEVCRKDVGVTELVGQTVNPTKGRGSCHTREELELFSPAPPAYPWSLFPQWSGPNPRDPQRRRALDILSSKE